MYNYSPIRVGDIVTRGKSKLQWQITALEDVCAPTLSGSPGLLIDTIAILAPIGKGRYTNASCSVEKLHLVQRTTEE